MSFFKSANSGPYKAPRPTVQWTAQDLRYNLIQLLLFLIVWPVLIIMLSLYLRNTEITEISPIWVKFADFVLGIVPDSCMRPYHQNVATSIYNTNIIMAFGWSLFVPLIFVMAIYRNSSFFISIERTFPYSTGFRPVWLGLLFRVIIACGVIYVVAFHGIYIKRLLPNPRSGLVAYSLVKQGFIAAFFSVSSAIAISVLINTCYLTCFRKKRFTDNLRIRKI